VCHKSRFWAQCSSPIFYFYFPAIQQGLGEIKQHPGALFQGPFPGSQASAERGAQPRRICPGRSREFSFAFTLPASRFLLHASRSPLLRPPSSVLRLPSSVFRPPSSVFRPPSSVLRPPSSVLLPASRFTLHAPRSPVLRPPSSVLRLPSSVLRPASRFPLPASRFTLRYCPPMTKCALRAPIPLLKLAS